MNFLLSIPGVTLSKAKAIVRLYKTLQNLI
jgi:hypothetical protein